MKISTTDALALKKIETGKKLTGKEITSLVEKKLIGDNAITKKGKKILKQLNKEL